jgi:hypothetical protein
MFRRHRTALDQDIADALTERLAWSSRRTDPVRVSPVGLRTRLVRSSSVGLQQRLARPTARFRTARFRTASLRTA